MASNDELRVVPGRVTVDERWLHARLMGFDGMNNYQKPMWGWHRYMGEAPIVMLDIEYDDGDVKTLAAGDVDWSAGVRRYRVVGYSKAGVI